jgi:hypothetical protein
MSQTFSIACKDCKEHLWIAQGSFANKKRGNIYTSDKHKKALYEFFRRHQGHNLIFDENCETEIADYEEVEITGEDETSAAAEADLRKKNEATPGATDKQSEPAASVVKRLVSFLSWAFRRNLQCRFGVHWVPISDITKEHVCPDCKHCSPALKWPRA